jgi:hypothetical protein
MKFLLAKMKYYCGDTDGYHLDTLGDLPTGAVQELAHEVLTQEVPATLEEIEQETLDHDGKRWWRAVTVQCPNPRLAEMSEAGWEHVEDIVSPTQWRKVFVRPVWTLTLETLDELLPLLAEGWEVDTMERMPWHFQEPFLWVMTQ